MAATRLTGFKYLHYQIRRAFIEYPEVSYTTLLCLVFTPAAIRRMYWESKHPNCLIRSYKDNYTVYRPDDPRSYRIRCSPDLPPGDPHLVVV